MRRKFTDCQEEIADCAGFQLSVGYDGRLYDCDFNQAAGLPICSGEICYACTAGQGSSCGGASE